MKPIKMFMLKTCPHCQRALRWMDEVKAEHPEYNALSIAMIEEREQPDVANAYDYYYVPCYYVDEVKVHEGVASKEIVQCVFAGALED